METEHDRPTHLVRATHGQVVEAIAQERELVARCGARFIPQELRTANSRPRCSQCFPDRLEFAIAA